ncbi:hypothetical protein ADUPG1_011642, partial [Aduncisulcus paluster]
LPDPSICDPYLIPPPLPLFPSNRLVGVVRYHIPSLNIAFIVWCDEEERELGDPHSSPLSPPMHCDRTVLWPNVYGCLGIRGGGGVFSSLGEVRRDMGGRPRSDKELEELEGSLVDHLSELKESAGTNKKKFEDIGSCILSQTYDCLHSPVSKSSSFAGSSSTTPLLSPFQPPTNTVETGDGISTTSPPTLPLLPSLVSLRVSFSLSQSSSGIAVATDVELLGSSERQIAEARSHGQELWGDVYWQDTRSLKRADKEKEKEKTYDKDEIDLLVDEWAEPSGLTSPSGSSSSIPGTFGFVRLRNGYEWYFYNSHSFLASIANNGGSSSSHPSLLGRRVSVVLPALKDSDQGDGKEASVGSDDIEKHILHFTSQHMDSLGTPNTCLVQGTISLPPSQFHWIRGKIACIISNSDLVGTSAASVIAGSFKHARPKENAARKRYSVAPLQGFIIVDPAERTHVDVVFFRVTVPPSITKRMKPGVSVMFTLKENAYYKPVDATPFSLLGEEDAQKLGDWLRKVQNVDKERENWIKRLGKDGKMFGYGSLPSSDIGTGVSWNPTTHLSIGSMASVASTSSIISPLSLASPSSFSMSQGNSFSPSMTFSGHRTREDMIHHSSASLLHYPPLPSSLFTALLKTLSTTETPSASSIPHPNMSSATNQHHHLSLWCTERVCLPHMIFGGNIQEIKARFCVGLRPDVHFYNTFLRYLIAGKFSLVYVPRPTLYSSTRLLHIGTRYRFAVFFSWDDKKKVFTPEATNIVSGKLCQCVNMKKGVADELVKACNGRGDEALRLIKSGIYVGFVRARKAMGCVVDSAAMKEAAMRNGDVMVAA